MTEATPQNDVGENKAAPGSEVRLRTWPVIPIVAVGAVLSLVVSHIGATAVHSVIAFVAAPVLAALGLIVWWLAASCAPKRDRLIGLAFLAAALAGVLLTQDTFANGRILLIVAAPVLTAVPALFLMVGFWIRWSVRRWMAVALMLLCVGALSFLRVEGMSGTLVPFLTFRWSPAAAVPSAELPRLEGGGTATLPEQATTDDWPGFRGAARDGRLTGTVFASDWSTPPRELWRQRIGAGWSSFAVIGDYVFTQEQRGTEELVTCYRGETGENVWVNRIEEFHDDAMGPGPRATPTFDRGRLYTQGATGIVQCLDAATGATIWKRDVKVDVGAGTPGWGFSASPLVVGELVIVSGGGDGKGVAAYNRASGELAWAAGRAAAGYSSPQLVVMHDVPQIVMNNDFGMQSFDPASGALLWEHEWKAKGSPRVVQPLVTGPGSIVLGATGTMGAQLLRVEHSENAWNVREEWTTKKFRPYFNDFVLHKGYCYGFDGDRLACMDAATGKSQWQGKRYGGQLLLVADMDMLLVLSESGEVVLVNAAPEAANVAASFQAITGKTWNHPVVAHGKLFVRNAEEAACFALPDGGQT